MLICSTVPPYYIETLPSRIAETGRLDVQIVDCQVLEEATKVADGALTMFASGTEKGLAAANNLLSSIADKLHVVPGGVGAARKVNMINQHLIGIHIAVAAEALGLAIRMGLDTQAVFDIISKAAGSSWAFKNRGSRILAQDWEPLSTTNELVTAMVC